jgi:hypothetical protein
MISGDEIGYLLHSLVRYICSMFTKAFYDGLNMDWLSGSVLLARADNRQGSGRRQGSG